MKYYQRWFSFPFSKFDDGLSGFRKLHKLDYGFVIVGVFLGICHLSISLRCKHEFLNKGTQREIDGLLKMKFWGRMRMALIDIMLVLRRVLTIVLRIAVAIRLLEMSL